MIAARSAVVKAAPDSADTGRRFDRIVEAAATQNYDPGPLSPDEVHLLQVCCQRAEEVRTSWQGLRL